MAEAERVTVDSLLGFSVLDYLAFRCGCFCLSDLRSIHSGRLFYAVEATPEAAFSQESWDQALVYLTGEKAAEPRRALLAALEC